MKTIFKYFSVCLCILFTIMASAVVYADKTEFIAETNVITTETVYVADVRGVSGEGGAGGGGGGTVINPPAIIVPSGTAKVGDVDGDGNIDVKDIIMLRRYVAGGYNVEIIESAGDVDKNGEINADDIILVRKHLAKGYGVELNSSDSECKHERMRNKPYYAPTPTMEGQIEHWICRDCRKYFADEDGMIEISYEDTIIYYDITKDVFVLSLYDLHTAPDGYKGTWKYYNMTGRTDTVEVAEHANIYINGIKYDEINNINDYDGKLTSGMSGTIEFALLDPTITTTEYDTVYITATRAFVVDEVNINLSTVKAKNTNGLVDNIFFDEDASDIEATLYDADGYEMDWDDLEENDVLMLSYIDTDDKEIYTAKVIDNTVEGRVDGLSGSINSVTRGVVVGGTFYKVAVGAEYDTSVKAGDDYVFYLDDFEQIVYFEIIPPTISKNYGYVIATSNLLSEFQIEILTKENTVEVLDINNTIRFNDDKGMEVVDGTASGKQISYSTIANLKDTVIIYDVSSTDKITAIFTPEKRSVTNDEDLDSAFTYDDEFGIIASNTSILNNYDADNMTFDDGYRIDENTVIFLKDQNNAKFSDVFSLTALADGDKLVGATLYSVDADGYISCIFVNDTEYASIIGENTDYSLFVLKISKSTDYNLNDIWIVSGYNGLKSIEITTEFELLDNLSGTLVVPAYSIDEMTKGFKRVAPIAGTETIIKKNGEKVEKSLYYGNLTEINGNKLTVDGRSIKVGSDTNVYVYDLKKANSGRGYYQIDAEGYIQYSDDPTYGLFYGTDSSERQLTVDVYIYFVDGDVNTGNASDIVYVIK